MNIIVSLEDVGPEDRHLYPEAERAMDPESLLATLSDDERHGLEMRAQMRAGGTMYSELTATGQELFRIARAAIKRAPALRDVLAAMTRAEEARIGIASGK